MDKYYTRACNFYFGKNSQEKIKKNLALPLGGNKNISFDNIEIISRKKKKKIYFKEVKSLRKNLKKKIQHDLKFIIKKKRFKKLNLNETPLIMGIANLTPDSFSDGGLYNKGEKSFSHIKKLLKQGCDILDVGGESTRPGSNEVEEKVEWKRIKNVLKKFKTNKIFLSLDTRKSMIMKKAIKFNINLINDISGLEDDKDTIEFLKKNKIPFVINHIKGTPKTMHKKPKYKNVLLDVYDYFSKKINKLRKSGINHNNIILDPGIGFGKNLKHNITLLSKISIFHSLGFPIMLGISRKKFIRDLSGANDSKERIGGTIATSLFAITQGIQILRVHDVNEVKQSIKVFKSLYK